ncbi:hypothetical protein ThvES_00017460 [Thiovulum sp. ES]|nr:hypothetical protein ThvES_00017460 [Thiovulum sp. ES]
MEKGEILEIDKSTPSAYWKRKDEVPTPAMTLK